MSSRAARGSAFLALRLLLTEACDLACVFCHNEGQAQLTRRLDLSTGTLADLLSAGARFRLRQVKFSGGEPTLHPSLLPYLEVASQAALDTAVISNGQATSTLVAAAGRGARICVNLPTLDPDAYRRLTKGELAPVLATLDALAVRGADVSLNSYVSPRPGREHVGALVAFARQRSSRLKFLLPCQVGSPAMQDVVAGRCEEHLEALGGTCSDRQPFASTWSVAGVRVRIVYPWCPRACREAGDWYRSLRLAADRTLRPCFGGSSVAVPLLTGSVDEMAASLSAALAHTGRGCAGGMGVELVRRQPAYD